MLLWERLSALTGGDKKEAPPGGCKTLRARRLPYDRQCVAITKSGRRCRGRIRGGQDLCLFHDPSVSEARRRQSAAKGGRSHHRLAHLPDGYLRKLTSRRAVGEAMDRLYRETRLGLITTEMAAVLFNILTRLVDSGLLDGDTSKARSSPRSRVDRLRPRLTQLLTRAERAAWRKAVANAPAAFLHADHPQGLPAQVTGVAVGQASKPVADRLGSRSHNDTPTRAALTAAS